MWPLVIRPAFVFLLAAALMFAATASRAQGTGESTHEFQLDNGMKVVVKEDRRAPVVVAMVWYRAGSIDETNGTTGVAHVLEHMMFKGTARIPVGEFSRRVARAGGRDNAFTGRDYTAYFQNIHKSQLPLMLEMEADRMTNLTLAREEFDKEIRVVMEERRWRTDDRATSLVYEAMMATAFQAHPYRTPIVGWMNDLQNMSVDDARDWYRRWYAPNNAVLVVVGDVRGSEVLDLARRHFGAIPARELPPRKPQTEPDQTGIRRVTVKAPSERPYILMGYRVPVLRDAEKDWEPYALDVLEGILSGNEGARLNASLVRGSRLAAGASASYGAVARGPGMFILAGAPSEGRTVAELEGALKGEIARIARDGVAEDELARVKAQVVAGQVFSRDSMMFQARQIGALETIGLSHRTIDVQIRRLREVTADQVREVAMKYFVDDGLTVAVLDPQSLERGRTRPAPAGLRH
jgi:zinc protease